MTNIGTDHGQLSAMAFQAFEALRAEKIEVLADKGYFKSEEIAKCEDAGIPVYVPKPVGRQLNIRSGRSKHGWAQRTLR